MTGRPLLIVVVLALAAFVLAAAPAYAGDVLVPIHGSYSGTLIPTDPTHVVFTGTGISSHLGRGANEGAVVITGVDSSGCLPNINVETLTAANGDSITITSNDVACPVAPNVVHGIGTWTVTGGTGRFANITGQGTIDGYGDFAQGTFDFSFTGLISAPGRD
jgi:hypothetical protein